MKVKLTSRNVGRTQVIVGQLSS
ncbi:MAG: hypothetical protein ACYC04_07295 [Sulfurovum sp.]